MSLSRGARANITGIHAAVLLTLCAILSANTLLGAFFGLGAYPFLLTNRLAASGLLQAYLLMGVIAITLLVAFFCDLTFHRAWHWLAIGGHLCPVVVVICFSNSTPQMKPSLVLISLMIHGAAILAELYALFQPSARRK